MQSLIASRTTWLGLMILVVLTCGGSVSQGKEPITFEKHVRPILKANCFHCHGEEEELKGKLDLRLAKHLIAGGESGPAIDVGNAAMSVLIHRVTSGEMPPSKKKLTVEEIKTLRDWIDAGAKTVRDESQANQPDDFTPEEREFWAFQPVKRPPLPSIKQFDAVASPIDVFLLAELEKVGRGFSPATDRRTLARRLSLNLLGLPPTEALVDAFMADESPEAVATLVDHLLASPNYGERWGRHWLDVAGYADSDGFAEQDPERKYSYKYRDYVVRAFNEDKPWDQFIVEQMAGDELLTPPYAGISAEETDKLIATGFLRMGPDGTGIGGVDQNVARNEVVAETIKIVSTSLLGLSVGCAQCHNHRYDPISQVDYFRIRAIIEPAYDWKNWRVPNGRLLSLWTSAERKLAADIDREQKELTAERLKVLDAIVQEVFDREVLKLPEEKREIARVARTTAVKERTPEQRQILKDQPSLNVDRGSVYLYEQKRIADHNKAFDDRDAELKKRRPQEEFVVCLTEVPGQVPTTRLFARGDFNAPKQEVAPGELSIVAMTAPVNIAPDDPQVPTTGRRLNYARHLTSGRHPLVARVLVNRMWMHHFGRGLVATPSDFGRLGARPSHPELLDWLASEFVSSGWSLKHLHRLILTSTAYQQSSRRTQELDHVDSDNRLLGRMSVRRLEAETLRDAVLASAGMLNQRFFGKPVPVTPDEVGQIILGVDTRDTAGRPTKRVVSINDEEFRRSIYVQVRRSMPLSMLEAFDAPDMRPNCDLRNSSTVSSQSLLLMNNEFMLEQAEFMAALLESQTADRSAQITAAWRRALGRDPTPEQTQSALQFLDQQATELATLKNPDPKAKDASPSTRALASYCQALLSSNRFLYVD